MNKIVQFVTGLLSGLVAPAIAWLIFGIALNNRVVYNDKPVIPYLVSLLVNLILLRYLIRNGKELPGYGLMISTLIVAVLIFKFKQ